MVSDSKQSSESFILVGINWFRSPIDPNSLFTQNSSMPKTIRWEYRTALLERMTPNGPFPNRLPHDYFWKFINGGWVMKNLPDLNDNSHINNRQEKPRLPILIRWISDMGEALTLKGGYSKNNNRGFEIPYISISDPNGNQGAIMPHIRDA